MKNILTAFLLLTLLTSCVSTKVSSNNNFNYSVLNLNSKYIVETKDGSKIRSFEFIKQNESQIFGKSEDKNLTIEKSNINKVSKFSAGKTIPIIIGAVAAALLIPAYAKNKPVGQ